MSPPQRQWTLQERSKLLEKMVTNSCRNMKGGWAAAEATAVASEGYQKLLT